MAKRRPSGDGMVRKREDGRWEGRIVVGCWTANRDQKGRRIGIQRTGEKNGKKEEASDSYQESGK